MCSSGDRDLDSLPGCGSGNVAFERFQPPGNLLGIVHLWRDPTDNLMSRFHHERNANRVSVADSKQGFQEFVSENMVKFMRSYTTWHCNLLILSKHTMPYVPVLSCDYDDYHTKFNATLERLLHFLSLDDASRACCHSALILLEHQTAKWGCLC